MRIKTVRCRHVRGILDEPIGICETGKTQPFDDWRDDGNRNIQFALIEITTDDGITGLSRSCGLQQARNACRMFSKSLVGRDPHDIDEIWDKPWFKDKFKTFEEGRADNIRIARELRETLGPDDRILLSAYQGWTEEYAIDMLKAIEPALRRPSDFPPPRCSP